MNGNQEAFEGVLTSVEAPVYLELWYPLYSGPDANLPTVRIFRDRLRDQIPLIQEKIDDGFFSRDEYTLFSRGIRHVNTSLGLYILRDGGDSGRVIGPGKPVRELLYIRNSSGSD